LYSSSSTTTTTTTTTTSPSVLPHPFHPRIFRNSSQDRRS
jgi:hypothetical protein